MATTRAKRHSVRSKRAFYRTGRGLAVAAAGLTLAACTTDTRLERSSLNTLVPETQAIALPPAGGPAIVSVIERRYANAIEQNIVLASNASAPGQNTLRVQMFGPVGSEAGSERLTDRPIALARIASEMREQFPGIAMQRSDFYTQNGFGPFGYAIGRHGTRDLCIYAWQRLAGSTQGAPFANMGAIHTRLRLCQTGATEETLLSVMYGYTLNTAFSSTAWNPYGRAPGADARLGLTGQPIHPGGTLGPAHVLQPVAAPTPAPRQRQRQPQPSAQPEQVTPAAIQPPPPGSPIVPPPPAEAAREQVIVPPPPPSDDNR